jgi:demethylspheroidene O-methyltransferase
MAWLDRWIDFRNSLIRDPRFQSFALRFPLTRPIAKARSRAVFDLCAGFVYSQILRACIELKLLEAVSEQPASLSELVSRLSLTPERALTLIRAAMALGLLQERSDGRISPGPHGAALIGNPWIKNFIAHHDHFYHDLADPVALLRGPDATALQQYWAYAHSETPQALEDKDVSAYSELMASSQMPVAAEVLDARVLGRAKVLMDIGGGDGSFIAAAAERFPHLRFIHVDLAAVSELARKRLAQAGLEQRVSFVPANFLVDDLPKGADAATLVRIVHDHDDAAVSRLFAAVSRALPSHGELIIAEAISGMRGVEPVTDAYFNLYFTAMGSGKTRTVAELTALLRPAGFIKVQLRSARNPLVASVLVAAH